MRSRAIVAAAVGLLGLGGTAAPAAAQEAFRIGLVTDLSSIYTDSAGKGSVTAAQMAIDDFGGSVLGRKIELLSGDDLGKADVGSALTRKWYDVDKAEVVISSGASSVALANQSVARERKKVILFSGPGVSDLTGKACSPYSTHWSFDSFTMAATAGKFLASQSGGKSWYFITADYAFGNALERDTTRFIQEAGGKVAGGVKAPLGTPDFSSFLLQAQGSPATMIGLAIAGQDLLTAIKQASEFGMTDGPQSLAGLMVFITDVHGMGLAAARGIITNESFYWDLDDKTRAWTRRYQERLPGKVPNMVHASVYSSLTHYLKAVQAVGSTDTEAVMRKMKETPVNDFYNRNVAIRPDGKVLHDMHLFKVKTPSESRYPFDYYSLIGTVPGAQVARPMAEGGCPLVP